MEQKNWEPTAGIDWLQEKRLLLSWRPHDRPQPRSQSNLRANPCAILGPWSEQCPGPRLGSSRAVALSVCPLPPQCMEWWELALDLGKDRGGPRPYVTCSGPGALALSPISRLRESTLLPLKDAGNQMKCFYAFLKIPDLSRGSQYRAGCPNLCKP